MAVEAVFTPSADGSVKLVNWQPATWLVSRRPCACFGTMLVPPRNPTPHMPRNVGSRADDGHVSKRKARAAVTQPTRAAAARATSSGLSTLPMPLFGKASRKNTPFGIL